MAGGAVRSEKEKPMKALEAPDTGTRQACEKAARTWLHDVAQVWVLTDACRGVRRRAATANVRETAGGSQPAAQPLKRPGAGRHL